MRNSIFILGAAFYSLFILPLAFASDAEENLHAEYQKYCGDWPGARWGNPAEDEDTYYLLRTADGPPSSMRVCNASKDQLIYVTIDGDSKKPISVSLQACVDVVGARQISIEPKKGDPHIYGYYCRIQRGR